MNRAHPARMLVACVAAAATFACPKPQVDPPAVSGDEQLAKNDLAAACAAYKASLAASPADSHSAFGAALTCGVLLPDSPAITEILDKCGEPHVDVAGQFFGPTGAFAKDKADRQGAGSVTLQIRNGTTGTFGPLAFTADTFRTHAELRGYFDPQATNPVDKNFLTLRVNDVQYRDLDSAELSLSAMFEGAHRNYMTGTIDTPLADGVQIPVTELNGNLSLDLPAANGAWDFASQPISGTVKFLKAGAGQIGDLVQIEFDQVVLRGNHSCGSGPCDPGTNTEFEVQIDGTILDTVGENFEPTFPFDSIVSDTGTPYRPDYVVMLDKCPGLSAEYLRGQLQKLVGDVEAIRGYLDIVVKDPNADAFQFKLPGALFSVDGEIPFNATDARVLKAAVELALASGKLALNYQYLSKPFADFLGTFDYWIYAQDGSPTSRQQRDWLVAQLVADLNATFLARQASFDLSPVKANLAAAFEAASAALTRTPQAQGLFNFQATNSRAFANDVNGLVTFLNGTLNNATLAGFPHSPDFKLSLKAFFDAPLDKSELHTASADGTGIFKLLIGDPSSMSASDRNDQMQLDGDGLQHALSGFFTVPADQSSVTCDPSQTVTGCPGKYTCSPTSATTGTCQAPNLELVDQAAMDQAMPSSGTPAFFNQASVAPLAWIN